MQYRKDKYGNDISILGFGCMRFTKRAGQFDIAKAQNEVKAAYEAGINYYDTAYLYPGNEVALGKILKNLGIREDVYIATKLPHYLIKKPDSMEKMFAEQLDRLQTDYIDYYLMHMLTDVKSWKRMSELGAVNFIEDKKAGGAIRQIGFSYHGNTEKFIELIDAYDWDFCMIQYNYMDENTQAGRRGLEYAAAKGIPVIIMEPLRGGRLANNLPPKAVKLFEHHPSGMTPPQWAFRWLWNQPDVTCVLSGMNSLEMIEDNVTNACNSQVSEFGADEETFLKQVGEAINERMKVRCTGCGYCLPCPRGVDIPGVFSAYNRRYIDGLYAGIREYIMCTTLRKDFTGASKCIGCGLCEEHCPQVINIREELINAKKKMEGVPFKAASFVIRNFMKY